MEPSRALISPLSQESSSFNFVVDDFFDRFQTLSLLDEVVTVLKGKNRTVRTC